MGKKKVAKKRGGGSMVKKKANGGSMVKKRAGGGTVKKRAGGGTVKKKAGVKKRANGGSMVKKRAGGGGINQHKRMAMGLKDGGPVGKKQQGFKDRKDESIAMRVKKKRTPAQLKASRNESYGKFGKGTGKGVINKRGGGIARRGTGIAK